VEPPDEEGATGGRRRMRKRTLKNRRGVNKRNVRGSGRRKNRANSSHSNTR
jgi:hypothetical protein